MLDYKTFVQLFVRQLQLSKTKPCVLNKTKQKDEFIARLSLCQLGNSRQQKQWVANCSQTKGVLWGTCGSYLALSVNWLPRGLPCLNQGSWVTGTRLMRWHEQTWYLEVGEYPLLISGKSCKFLWDWVKFPLWVCVDLLCFIPDIKPN